MNLNKKRIWIDIEEPKTAIMFKSLVSKLEEEKASLLITARNYDSTFQILDDLEINYIKVGKHGGEKLDGKLKAYIDRLGDLFPYIFKFKPEFFITFSSIEGTRISYGLKVPSIGYNDEPRNVHVCKLLFPYLDQIITPECVPKEWYINLHANPEKLIRYNGIDEIAWLTEFTPNNDILKKFDVQKGQYIIIRSEPSFASYFLSKLEPEKTLISDFFPLIFKKYPNLKYFIIPRTDKQENYLKVKLRDYIRNKNTILTRYLPNMSNFCFYSALVISGGGTIVRESSLLGVPSIEFFPGDTAPQESFLINNDFPLFHIKNYKKVAEKAIEILSSNPKPNRFSEAFRERLNDFENPNEICFKKIKERIT
ncbi:MAG: DUF354 domain-containing protein [Promethearchaeota archaeon]